jgi:hypothetical protein
MISLAFVPLALLIGVILHSGRSFRCRVSGSCWIGWEGYSDLRHPTAALPEAAAVEEGFVVVVGTVPLGEVDQDGPVAKAVQVRGTCNQF